MLRQRKTVAVVCIALVVFAAFLPLGAPALVWATLAPLWLIVPAADAICIGRVASRCDDQPVSLLSLVLLRAPPIPLIPA